MLLSKEGSTDESSEYDVFVSDSPADIVNEGEVLFGDFHSFYLIILGYQSKYYNFYHYFYHTYLIYHPIQMLNVIEWINCAIQLILVLLNL